MSENKDACPPLKVTSLDEARAKRYLKDINQVRIPLSSRYGMTEVVYFQPHITLDKRCFGCASDDYTHAIQAKVVGIHFIAGKVLYDLALWMEDEGEYYEALPICAIDSALVLPDKAQWTEL